jgi:hypothetical protein
MALLPPPTTLQLQARRPRSSSSTSSSRRGRKAVAGVGERQKGRREPAGAAEGGGRRAARGVTAGIGGVPPAARQAAGGRGAGVPRFVTPVVMTWCIGLVPSKCKGPSNLLVVGRIYIQHPSMFYNLLLGRPHGPHLRPGGDRTRPEETRPSLVPRRPSAKPCHDPGPRPSQLQPLLCTHCAPRTTADRRAPPRAARIRLRLRLQHAICRGCNRATCRGCRAFLSELHTTPHTTHTRAGAAAVCCLLSAAAATHNSSDVRCRMSYVIHVVQTEGVILRGPQTWVR